MRFEERPWPDWPNGWTSVPCSRSPRTERAERHDACDCSRRSDASPRVLPHLEALHAANPDDQTISRGLNRCREALGSLVGKTLCTREPSEPIRAMPRGKPRASAAKRATRTERGVEAPSERVCRGSGGEAPGSRWLRGRDLNPRPLGYEPNELPDCSTPRQETPIVARFSACRFTSIKISPEDSRRAL